MQSTWSGPLWAPRSPLDLSIERPADGSVLLAAAIAAAGTDLALRSGGLWVAGSLLIAVVAALMLASGRVSNPQAVALIAAAPAFGIWLALRASPWLIPLDVLAAGGLLALGASFASGGSVMDLPVPNGILRGIQAALHGLLAPMFLWSPVRRLARPRPREGARSAGTGRAVLRGVLLAIPVLVVLGVLLASADAVFASLLRLHLNIDPASLAADVVALTLGAWGMAGLLRLASAGQRDEVRLPGLRVGRVETTIVLGSLVALFGTFAAAQLVALSAGGRHVLETEGLTYARYARTGFFQLLAVAAITLLVLLALRAAADRSTPGARRSSVLLSEGAVALTLVIVVVAVHRLDLYEQAFGLTMLRLYAKVFAIVIGVVFVLLGLALAGLWSRRAWLVPAAGAIGLVTLFALNVVGPEGVVVRHNVGHASAAHRFDPDYVTTLSADAVPTLVGLLPRLTPGQREAVLTRLCAPGSNVASQRFTGWAAFNLSLEHARELLDRTC